MFDYEKWQKQQELRDPDAENKRERDQILCQPYTHTTIMIISTHQHHSLA